MTLERFRDWGFCVLMLIGALLPYVPEMGSPLALLFSAVFGVLLFASVGAFVLSDRSRTFGLPELLVMGFFGSVALSFPVAVANDVSVGDWARGATPFFLVSGYFLFSPVRDEKRAQFLMNVLHATSVVWMVKIFIVTGMGLGRFMTGEITRLTFITMDLTLPFSLVGFVLSLFNPHPLARRLRLPLSVLFMVLIVGSGYRSQLLLAMVVLAVFLYRLPPSIRLGWTVFLVLGGMVVFAAVVQTRFWSDYVLRFQTVHQYGESSRALEMRYALGQFAGSPIVGRGLGFPIPAEITFAGNVDYVTAAVGVSTVAYMHNAAGYMLMDLGVVGFCFYFGIYAMAFLRGAQGSRKGSPGEMAHFCGTLTLLTLLGFFLVEASFRQVQSNLLVVTLAALAWARIPSAPAPREAAEAGPARERELAGYA